MLPAKTSSDILGSGIYSRVCAHGVCCDDISEITWVLDDNNHGKNYIAHYKWILSRDENKEIATPEFVRKRISSDPKIESKANLTSEGENLLIELYLLGYSSFSEGKERYEDKDGIPLIGELKRWEYRRRSGKNGSSPNLKQKHYSSISLTKSIIDDYCKANDLPDITAQAFAKALDI